MGKLDLHMHSIYSDDGEYQPEALLQMCKDKGVTTFAIADHNSVKGSSIACQKQDAYDIRCIPAIEIDATCADVNYHILGYGINLQHPIFDEIENNVMQQELEASLTRAKLVREMGFDFDDEELKRLAPSGVISGECIAEACILKDKDHSHPLLQPYYAGGGRSDNPLVNFYWDICSTGKPAYVEIIYPSVKEIVDVLHQQGALAIIAHPGMNAKEDEQRLQALLDCGVDGVEVYSSYHNKEQELFYRTWAIKEHLLMTCGSDFHGKTKPSVHLAQCEMVPEDKAVLLQKLAEL